MWNCDGCFVNVWGNLFKKKSTKSLCFIGAILLKLLSVVFASHGIITPPSGLIHAQFNVNNSTHIRVYIYSSGIRMKWSRSFSSSLNSLLPQLESPLPFIFLHTHHITVDTKRMHTFIIVHLFNRSKTVDVFPPCSKCFHILLNEYQWTLIWDI